MSETVAKLIKFSKLLDEPDTKLTKKQKILTRLYGIDLNLSEISDSDIVKSVKKVKKHIPDLSEDAVKLLNKWKTLLNTHIQSESAATSSLKKYEPKSTNSPKKNGLDASSGLSFMDCMMASSTNPSPRKPISAKKRYLKPESPKNVIMDSLDRIDVDYAAPSGSLSPVDYQVSTSDPVSQEDDGNLKFKSARIIYAPKHNLNKLGGTHEVPLLVNLCTEVLRRNISQVDYVGDLPWFIFKNALVDASDRDLLRIESLNPQFKEDMKGIYDRFVLKDFPKVNWAKMKRDNPKKSEGQLYKELMVENQKRLDRFINKAASRVKADKEAQRSVRATDVIVPRSVQRARTMHGPVLAAPKRMSGLPSTSSSSTASSGNLIFKPRNMSHPDGVQGLVQQQNQKAQACKRPATGGNMMQQLKRKFVSTTAGKSSSRI